MNSSTSSDKIISERELLSMKQEIEKDSAEMLKIATRLRPLMARQDQLNESYEAVEAEYQPVMEEILYEVIRNQETLFDLWNRINDGIDKLLSHVHRMKVGREKELADLEYLIKCYLFFKTELIMAMSWLKTQRKDRVKQLITVLEKDSEVNQAMDNLKFLFHCSAQN